MIRRMRHAAILALSLATMPAAHAIQVTAHQRVICTPDAMRLCRAQITNRVELAKCMVREKANLSTACRAVVTALEKQYFESQYATAGSSSAPAQ
jgi:hypothetical protein